MSFLATLSLTFSRFSYFDPDFDCDLNVTLKVTQERLIFGLPPIMNLLKNELVYFLSYNVILFDYN